MENNPYLAPAANLFGATASSMDAVPQEAITPLQRTRGWVRLLSVLMWVLIAVMLLLSATTGFVGLKAKSLPGQRPPGMPELWVFLFLAVTYVLLAMVYIFPAIKLWAYGSRIHRLVTTRSVGDLAAALEQQRSLWKFAGIFALITVVLVLLTMVASIIMSLRAAGAVPG